MFKIIYISAFVLCSIESVKVHVENEQNKYTTSFPFPIIDGSLIKDNTIDTLELQSREPKDKNDPIKMIANFPKLLYINISYFELEVLPKFLNLPVVELLIFEQNDLTKITASSFSQLQTLKQVYFSSNIIQEIENGAFGKSLQEVTLDCNLLTEINRNWFQNPGELQLLAIRNNKITYLEENLFEPFINLIKIDLANNEITTIGNGAFSGSKHYVYVNIQRNQISELSPTIFTSSNITFDLFNIGLNKLNFLAQSFLDKIKVKRFLIFGNPWQCPCLKKIEYWLGQNNANSTVYASDRQKWSSNNPVCIFAMSFANSCVEVIDNELYNSYLENLGQIDTKSYC